jgi:protein-S-isoprenylcysteine O-methyltransferase Ste14
VLAETHIALFLLACLAIFTAINLRNILKFHRRNLYQASEPKTERPADKLVDLAAVGTGIYFLETTLYVFIVLTSIASTTIFLTQQLLLQPLWQTLGLISTSAGYSLFIWSILVRGRYATSWSMRPNHKLITTGPYYYVRHPSYLGYFLMFTGLPLLVPSLIMLFPLMAVPGYYRITFQEEELLTQHFGDEYREYRKRTGRFLPRLRKNA